jgi:DNA helicase IV
LLANIAELSTVTNLSFLNAPQREAVTSERKRLLVLAGAGSGKTKTLLQKIIYLVEEKGVSPSEILAITFTKNAANEMLDRLILTADKHGEYEKILNSKRYTKEYKDRARLEHHRQYKWIEGLTVRTFHGFCYGMLRNYGVNEFDNQFKIIGDEKQQEDAELGKYTAPETAFEVYHKLLIELCEDTGFLLRLKRYILDYFVHKIHLDKEEDETTRIRMVNFILRSMVQGFAPNRNSLLPIGCTATASVLSTSRLLNVKDFEFSARFFYS